MKEVLTEFPFCPSREEGHLRACLYLSWRHELVQKNPGRALKSPDSLIKLLGSNSSILSCDWAKLLTQSVSPPPCL